ncbi:MAG: glycosyltransferase family 2 protein [Actinobacteria bacterium]|nr:glycosyltransferase family 2 protein [Actinomycetota bacterium]
MPADPLVSVVMPVRDAEPFLAEAIDSVLAQGYPVEVIAVEDRSRDASAAIARAYGPPVTCISTEPSGLGHARNMGIEAASGEYLTFIDADDLWPPGRLEIQLKVMEARPSPDVLFGREVRFPGAEDRPIPAQNSTTVFLRRATFERVGPFPTEWRLGEFLDWLLRAEDLGLSIAMLPDVVSYRRVHGGNFTTRFRDHYGDYAKVLGRALARRRAGTADPE